jgi:hypothetical protein
VAAWLIFMKVDVVLLFNFLHYFVYSHSNHLLMQINHLLMQINHASPFKLTEMKLKLNLQENLIITYELLKSFNVLIHFKGVEP